MLTVNVSINFSGNREEAFTFYKSVFGGDFPYVGRYKEMPPQEGMPPMTAELGEKIMHMSLPISAETCLMSSDAGGEWAPALTIGNNFAVSVTADSKEEADTLFNGLSAGGVVTMPIALTFWESYLGMCTDRFGINWMVSFEQSKPS